jgi:DNA mismatch endonuclease (patch repair protein)
MNMKRRDNLSPEDRRKAMQAVKGKGTKLERRLWGLLARMRLKKWKKNDETIVGKPDVVFDKKRVALFVDGCFWHGCRRCQRKRPKTNHMYWKRKIERNVELARLHNRRLRKHGWRSVRIWEHEMTDAARVKTRILHALQRHE